MPDKSIVAQDYPEADRALVRWARWVMSDRDNLGYPGVSSTGRVCEILRTRILPDRSAIQSSIAASLAGYQDDIAERVHEILQSLSEQDKRIIVAQYLGRVDGVYCRSQAGLSTLLGISEDTYRRHLRAALSHVQDQLTSPDGYIVA